MPTPVVFADFKLRQHNGNAKNLGSAAIKIGLVKSTWTPNAATDTLFSTITSGGKEVSGDGYTAGGAEIANSAVALDGSTVEWTHDDVTWEQQAGGFADGRYAVWYDSADSRLIMYMDLGADRGNVSGPLTLDVTPGTGVLQI